MEENKQKEQFWGFSKGGCVPNHFLGNPEVNLLRQAADGQINSDFRILLEVVIAGLLAKGLF